MQVQMNKLVLSVMVFALAGMSAWALPRQTFELAHVEARGEQKALKFPVAGNLDPVRGGLSCWVRLDSTEGNPPEYRNVLSMPFTGRRGGTGALWFWIHHGRPRVDFSDDRDSYLQNHGLVKEETWVHLVYNWDRSEGVGLFVDGAGGKRKSDSSNLIKAARESREAPRFSHLAELKQFVIGSRHGRERLGGVIEDLRIFDAPLTATDAKALSAAPPKAIAAEVARQRAAANRWKTGPALASIAPNAHVAAPGAVPGVPEDLRLLATYSPVEMRTDAARFNSIGELKPGELAGKAYLEAGRRRNDRFVLRLGLKKGVPLHVIEIDYPDNALRTMDIIAQPCKNGRDYVLQTGLFCGDEYANTGRMLTHRCLYWSGEATDVGLVVTTAREGAPAAVGEVRVYEVASGKLPAAAVREPEPGDDGWRRNFALYYEDPAICHDFGPQGGDDESFNALCDRLVAGMKFTGQNLFCYPGAWYHGLIGEDYMPRVHHRRYREAFMERFDREGLGFMPIIMQLSLQRPGDLERRVTHASITDGSLHDTAVSILSSGEPNGGWHGTPPNFNIAHPQVQEELMREVDLLLAEGAKHPSFRGIVLYLSRNSLAWFGDIEGGYNDYCIERFGESLGGSGSLGCLAKVDRKDPLRGKRYYETIVADPELLAKWIDWRCRTVADFYRRLAAKVAAVRPDLKFVVNSFLLPDIGHPDFGKENFIFEANRRAGLDVRLLEGVPNLTVAQTEIPADYRWFGPIPGRWKRAADPAAASAAHRLLYTKRGDFANVEKAAHPWVNIHDRYFENACGAVSGKRAKGQQTLATDWFSEHSWRVSTLNPSGRHALRMFAVPLYHNDVMTFSKGGFLIGTYGMEEALVPWMRAFRSLPAVKMTDCGGDAAVKVRRADFRGRTYFSAVNASDTPRKVHFAFPAGTVDAVSGESLDGQSEIELDAYGLRSFVKMN